MNSTASEMDHAYLDGRYLTADCPNPFGAPADNLLAWAFDFGRRETAFLAHGAPSQTPSWKREVWKREAMPR